MKAVILDAQTLGDDISCRSLATIADLTVYPLTAPDEIPERIAGADVIIVNKIRLHEANLHRAHPSLICVAATGYDNIDTAYCAKHGIAVCNVSGYSTHSVAQLTVAMVLHLLLHMQTFTEFVRNGSYTSSGVANRLSPPFHELYGKTWGIVGGGNIGSQVAAVAEAFGCRVIVHRRKQDPRYPTVTINELCRTADIITVHTPLTEETRNLISAERIASMKAHAIVVNTARGAVTDEAALAEAILSGKIRGLGTDVYSTEPMTETHPFFALRTHPSVCLTPHMAWGAVESRQRCMEEIAENMRAFFAGERRNRIV